MSFSNKVVIATGASAGIGAATAEMFSAAGAGVALVGRDEARLARVAARCEAAGAGGALVVRADVADDADARRVVQATLDRFGKIDVLVNNAGIVKFGTLLGGTMMDSFDEVMNINFRATVHLTSLATPHLIKTKGNVVNISSISGQGVSRNGFIPYGVSKAAMDHFTRGAALELAAAGVRVNAVSPGPVRTGILETAGYAGTMDELAAAGTALGRASHVDEIADLILYVASDRAKGVTGSNFVSDNGMLLKK